MLLWVKLRSTNEIGEVLMASFPVYSSLFSTIYDEPEPVGHLGRGTHYSILRAVEWLDVTRLPLTAPEIHDFAVVWDEDHDTRVIEAIEQIYMAGLLSPVQFIGERKGTLTVLVAARFYYYGSGEDIHDYSQAIEKIAESLDDPWPSKVGSFARTPNSEHQCITRELINDAEHKVLTYLKNIDSLWGLGAKPYKP